MRRKRRQICPRVKVDACCSDLHISIIMRVSGSGGKFASLAAAAGASASSASAASVSSGTAAAYQNSDHSTGELKPDAFVSIIESSSVAHLKCFNSNATSNFFKKWLGRNKARETMHVYLGCELCQVLRSRLTNRSNPVLLGAFENLLFVERRGLSQWMDLKAFRLTRKFISSPSVPVGRGPGPHDTFLLDLFNSVTSSGSLKVKSHHRLRVVGAYYDIAIRLPRRQRWCL